MAYPPQGGGGGITLQDVVNYLKTQGALNKEYDPYLAGLIPASKLDFSFGWELIGKVDATNVYGIIFNNLSGDDDELYMLITTIYNRSANDIQLGVNFYANGSWDNNRAHYARIAWINDAGTISTTAQPFNGTSGPPTAYIGWLPAGKTGVFWSIINAKGISNGTDTIVHVLSKGYYDGPVYVNAAGAWLKQGDITKIAINPWISSSTVTDINIRAYLFKPKW